MQDGQVIGRVKAGEWLGPGQLSDYLGTSERVDVVASKMTSDPDGPLLTPYSNTIGAQNAEHGSYQEALKRGEYGLQQPGNPSATGPDSITAGRQADGTMMIYMNDAKNTYVGTPGPLDWSKVDKPSWRAETESAIQQMNLNNSGLEQEIRDAWANGNVRMRGWQVDSSSSGQGRMTIVNQP
jgi:hypothetical protein